MAGHLGLGWGDELEVYSNASLVSGHSLLEVIDLSLIFGLP